MAVGPSPTYEIWLDPPEVKAWDGAEVGRSPSSTTLPTRAAAVQLAAAELDGVSEGRGMRAVRRAYAELAEVAGELAKAVEWADRASGLVVVPE